jgi:hypothetical protein
MEKTKKLKFNKKSVEKFIKLPFIFIYIALFIGGIVFLIFPLSGCMNKTQRYTEGIKTPDSATITIIEHDISENSGNGSSEGNKGSGGSEGGPDSGEGAVPRSFVENRIENIPFYCILINNGAGAILLDEKNMEESFNYLTEMVQSADEYNIKLTFIFSAQWTEYIAANSGRLAMLNEWKENGHEAANSADFGFTSFPGINEGLGNSANGIRERGMNEVILVGRVNGIERKWLSFLPITTEKILNHAIKTFGRLDSRVVYGVSAQSLKEQAPFFYAYIDYLHSLDPEGLNSKTVASIIEKKLIPEETTAVPSTVQ